MNQLLNRRAAQGYKARMRWSLLGVLGLVGCAFDVPPDVEFDADPRDAPPMVDAGVDAEPGARFRVTVTPGGNGVGTVTSEPEGIDCGSECSAEVDEGATVTLTATPETGSTFVGWTGGGCTGTGPCVLEVSADVVVEASFALDNSIIVTFGGNGDGLVTSDPAGIDCGDDCDEAYGPGTMVTLTAAAIGDSVFEGWSGGGCGGTGTCEVTTDSAVLVTAAFALNQHTLMVGTNGTGSGMVASVPGGIACPGDCAEAYDSGTSVALTATPIEGRFAGWSGACSGTGACTTALGVDRNVTATFTLITVGNVTSSSTNGIYTEPATIPIQVTFSDAVTVAGTPTLTLNSGGVATYGGGSFTNTLTFNYVVATGHASTDLDYSATDALALNGGTIQDALGNNATLTLPSPGGADSLGATKAIVIDAVVPVISAITGPAAYASSTSASVSYTVTELHPGSTSCMFTVGTGTINTCTTAGATASGLNQGAHTLRVMHSDTAGNVSAAQTYSWIVDTVDPLVSVIAGPASPSASTSATLTYTVTDANPGTSSCSQTAGTGTQTGCTNTSATYTALNSAGHTVRVTHTDLAGNPSTAKTHTWSVCPTQTFTFSTPTTGTTFTVPAGCGTLMDISAWGAGGGGGAYYTDGQNGGMGGGAGFAGGTLGVTVGQGFQVAVGGGGGPGGSSPAVAGTNGGGAGQSGGGGGGGWSGIYSGGTFHVIAAGAGGGGIGYAVATGGFGGAGGGGSGTAGEPQGFVLAGGGGSQTTGGTGGSGGGDGVSLAGGNGVNGGGAGGGGYFGGGGGNNQVFNPGSGGGGGSSFTSGTIVGGVTVAGSGSTPGNVASPHYLAGRGVGGTGTAPNGESGGSGLVVIVIR